MGEVFETTVYADVKRIQSTALTQSESEKLERLMLEHGRMVFAIAYSIATIRTARTQRGRHLSRQSQTFVTTSSVGKSRIAAIASSPQAT